MAAGILAALGMLSPALSSPSEHVGTVNKRNVCVPSPYVSALTVRPSLVCGQVRRRSVMEGQRSRADVWSGKSASCIWH